LLPISIDISNTSSWLATGVLITAPFFVVIELSRYLTPTRKPSWHLQRISSLAKIKHDYENFLTALQPSAF
jgi:hypothetical protein